MERKLTSLAGSRPKLSQADAQGKIGDGAGALVGAYFPLQLLGPFDTRQGDKVVGKNVYAPGDRHNITPGQAGASNRRARALGNRAFSSQYRLKRAYAAGNQHGSDVETVLVK